MEKGVAQVKSFLDGPLYTDSLEPRFSCSIVFMRMGSEEGHENTELVSSDEGMFGIVAVEARDVSTTEGEA